MNKNRKAIMESKGIKTGNYFSLELPEGLKPGTTINIVVTDGGAKIIADTFKLEDDILSDGYVRNTKLYRRFVMAQMFKMLREGYTKSLNQMGYDYTFKTLIEEMRVLSKLQHRDEEAFYERIQFFDVDVAAKMCEHYVVQLKSYIKNLPEKKCKGIPYVKIPKIGDVFTVDINRKIIEPKMRMIAQMKDLKNYNDVYVKVKAFWDSRIPLPQKTKKSPEWVDAFKGAGAFYTCKNLIMYHDCRVLDNQNGHFLNRDSSLQDLYNKAVSYKWEYYRLLAYLQKLIKDNNFNFDERMKELASAK